MALRIKNEIGKGECCPAFLFGLKNIFPD